MRFIVLKEESERDEEERRERNQERSARKLKLILVEALSFSLNFHITHKLPFTFQISPNLLFTKTKLKTKNSSHLHTHTWTEKAMGLYTVSTKRTGSTIGVHVLNCVCREGQFAGSSANSPT